MTTLNVTNLKNASSSTNNLVLNSNGSVTGAGKILQVVSGTHSAITSTTATSWTDVSSDVTLNITPSSTSSKIIVTGQLQGSCDNNAYATVFRDSTNLITATGSSNRIPAVRDYQDYDEGAWTTVLGVINIVDSPNTTSQVTYKWRFYSRTGGTFTINRADESSDQVYRVHPNTTLTLMEVAA